VRFRISDDGLKQLRGFRRRGDQDAGLRTKPQTELQLISPQTEPASVSPASPAIGVLVVISLIVANLRAGKRTVPGAY
jgi:hypothetical protein